MPPPIARLDIQELAKSLMDGDLSAEEAKRILCNTYDSLNSVRSKMTTIRDLVFKETPPMDVSGILELETDPPESMHVFVNSSRKQQYKIQRNHASNPTWSEEAENYLVSLEIVPACITGLVLTKRECNQLQQKSEQAVVDANMHPYVIEEGDKLISQIEEKMKGATEHDSIGDLAISILLATGRRTCEILNGASSFTNVDGEPYHALFAGQAKAGNDAPAYIIPILVPFAVLEHAMNVLRAKQGEKRFTNMEAKIKYQSAIRKRKLKMISEEQLALPPMKTHALRKVYVAMVQELFDSPYAFNATVMKCCGHSRIKDSLAYSVVKIKGIAENGRLGKMIVEDLRMNESDGESEADE